MRSKSPIETKQNAFSKFEHPTLFKLCLAAANPILNFLQIFENFGSYKLSSFWRLEMAHRKKTSCLKRQTQKKQFEPNLNFFGPIKVKIFEVERFGPLRGQISTIL